ncbi:MAG: sugar ABC transporter substrate-binding protein [Chloroflexota bacterium]
MSNKKFSRRDFLKAAAAGAAIAPTLSIPGLRAFGAPAAQDVVNLRMMAWGSPLEKANIETGLAAFMAENPSITVEYIHTPDRYDEILQTMIAGDTAPDVFKVGNPYPDLAVRNALMDITDRVKSDPVLGAPDYFFPFEEERSSLDGKWYGIGSTFQWRLIYYNKSMLETAGIEAPSTDPSKAWTWDKFLEVTTALTLDSAGKHPGEDGFDPEDVHQWGLFGDDTMYDNFIFSNGGTIIDPDTHLYMLDQPAAYDGIQAYADLRLANHVAGQSAVLTQMGMSSWQMLASGRVAMIMDGNWALQDIAKMGFEFGVGVLPEIMQPATVASSSRTSIYSKTVHPDEAWQLFRYLNMDEYQSGLIKVGLWGVSHQTLLTPDGVKGWLTPGVHPDNWLPLETEYKLNFGHVVPNVVGMTKTATMITQALADVWTGARTAKDVFTELNPALNQTLADEKARV